MSRPPEPILTEIADGVFGYVQPDGGWCLNNAGVVVRGNDVLVIDTAATRARADALRAAIAKVAAAAPRTVVNTHHHGDHTFGNCVFSPDAVVVAHRWCRDEMRAAGLGMRQLFPGVTWGDVRLVLPSITFDERIMVELDGLRAEVVHVGPAHTTNDVVVWLPDQGVLFAGDVVMSGATPFVLMGSVAGSLRAIERLREFDAGTVVCGHGPIAGPEVLDVTESYLRWLRRVAEDGIAAGISPGDLAKHVDLGEFADLLDSERLVGNLHRAYAELRAAPWGAPLDVGRIFQEMVEHHGGPPTCWA